MSNGKMILSVDDSATIRRVIADTAKTEGIITYEADSCISAFRLLQDKAGELDMIILDVNMPGMTGLDFLIKLKSHPTWSGIPVMMLTTEAEKATIVRAVQAGASNYLVKPFSRDDLLAKIRQTLNVS